MEPTEQQVRSEEEVGKTTEEEMKMEVISSSTIVDSTESSVPHFTPDFGREDENWPLTDPLQTEERYPLLLLEQHREGGEKGDGVQSSGDQVFQIGSEGAQYHSGDMTAFNAECHRKKFFKSKRPKLDVRIDGTEEKSAESPVSSDVNSDTSSFQICKSSTECHCCCHGTACETSQAESMSEGQSGKLLQTVREMGRIMEQLGKLDLITLGREVNQDERDQCRLFQIKLKEFNHTLTNIEDLEASKDFLKSEDRLSKASRCAWGSVAERNRSQAVSVLHLKYKGIIQKMVKDSKTRNEKIQQQLNQQIKLLLTHMFKPQKPVEPQAPSTKETVSVGTQADLDEGVLQALKKRIKQFETTEKKLQTSLKETERMVITQRQKFAGDFQVFMKLLAKGTKTVTESEIVKKLGQKIYAIANSIPTGDTEGFAFLPQDFDELKQLLERIEKFSQSFEQSEAAHEQQILKLKSECNALFRDICKEVIQPERLRQILQPHTQLAFLFRNLP